MKNYEFKATNLISKEFEENNFKYSVVNHQGKEEIRAEFSVNNGPAVTIRYIVRDNDNDVAVRIFRLVSNIAAEKRERALNACNMLNQTLRYMKFYIDEDGDINVEYDVPLRTSDDCIGNIAVEMLVRAKKILDSHFALVMKALYTDEELSIN